MTGDRIHILDDLVAQRIAAGEVIERPESVVRELMDNAIDAGSKSIDVHITDGGITEIRVIDDGHGMSPEDLLQCCKPHATSKISRIEDLYSLHTLGFRGEALYSIAACTRLSITSSYQGMCNTVKVTDGDQLDLTPGGNSPGTTVTARDIFYSIPGRRKFLKRPQAESAACRKTFLSKALPYHEIEFRFFNNGKLRIHLPASDPVQRITHAYPDFLQDVFIGNPSVQTERFTVQAVCSTPDIHRTDKNYLQVFVNRRRIQEYSLIQAITYGYNYHLPGGCYPYCFLFIDNDPELVDFNIHPAKREAKIRNISEIHHETVQMLKGWLASNERNPAPGRNQAAQQEISFDQQHESSRQADSVSEHARPAAGAPSSRLVVERKDTERRKQALRELLKAAKKETPSAEKKAEEVPKTGKDLPFRYLGQIFTLFLIAEQGDDLLIIDQHAAHERIIYEELKHSPVSQPLLIPIVFEPDPLVDDFLAAQLGIYADLGIELNRTGNTAWELVSIPAVCSSLQQDLVEFIMETTGNRDEIEKKLYAMISCRAAVKDGDTVDAVTAEHLIAEALSLPVKRCPHGRPIWKRISKHQLLLDVGRLL